MRNDIDNFLASAESSGIVNRRRFIQFVMILTAMPSEALAENSKLGILSVNGKKIQIADITKSSMPIRNEQRIMEYPITDEARRLLEKMRADEYFLQAEDYKSSDGYQLIMRKTATDLYKLAQQYAAMEGYGLAVFSAWRPPEGQRSLYAGAGKGEKGVKVASAEDSQHPRGGAMDVLLYKEEDGRIVYLTPDKKNPRRGKRQDIDRLHKYLQLAGFANYTEEPWHNEIGSEEWVEIMAKSGLRQAKNKLYQSIEKPVVK
jgi:D-alanyl-D-alanine dipeptidase